MSQGNAEFAEFFAASWDPCLRAVAASTGNLTLAEDQVAEAFARVWPCPSGHRWPRSPAGAACTSGGDSQAWRASVPAPPLASRWYSA